MRYSLWHQDTLIGHTTLSYEPCIPKVRVGELDPTEEGAVVLAGNEHLHGLELELRMPNGKVIPTESITTQDCNALLRRYPGNSLEDETPMDDLDPETRAAIAHDVALLEEMFAEEEPAELWRGYDEDDVWDESKPFWQIFVHLSDEADIPW